MWGGRAYLRLMFASGLRFVGLLISRAWRTSNGNMDGLRLFCLGRVTNPVPVLITNDSLGLDSSKQKDKDLGLALLGEGMLEEKYHSLPDYQIHHKHKCNEGKEILTSSLW